MVRSAFCKANTKFASSNWIDTGVPSFEEPIMDFITTPVIIAFVAGLIVGWNFFQQLAWVANLFSKIKK